VGSLEKIAAGGARCDAGREERQSQAIREKKKSTMKPKVVLFLCTGNYYRSRFAELLFNNSARRERFGWRAISRGIALELGVQNDGPISPHVLSGLCTRGVAVDSAAVRPPLPLALRDLIDSDRVAALKRDEHLPIIAQKFPEWASRIEYWHVDDLDLATPDEGLRKIEHNVTTLITRLSATGDS
jgi:protein-tyrosine phosphatase